MGERWRFRKEWVAELWQWHRGGGGGTKMGGDTGEEDGNVNKDERSTNFIRSERRCDYLHKGR